MSYLPLKGLTVLDLGWVIAGPHGTRLLSDLGAEIIRIESRKRVDSTRPDTPRKGVKDFSVEGGWLFQEHNRGKRGFMLNLKSEKGKEILDMLVKKCDIVTSNFAPRGIRSMGIDYESLKKIREDVITLNASGLGDWGPYADYATFAPVLQSISGLLGVIGYEGQGPLGYPGLLADYFGAYAVATAILGALEFRKRTGKGQFIDLAQSETTLSCLGVPLLECEANGIDRQPCGNHHWAGQMAPHNCYRCKGEDAWCVIAAGDDGEWQALKAALEGRLDADKFDTLEGRIENQAELDGIVEAWTRERTPSEAAGLLQAAGVSAAEVQPASELLRDEHLRARGYFKKMSFAHDDAVEPDSFMVTGLLTPMEGAGMKEIVPAPPIGQDNDWVLNDFLGLDKAYIAEAEAAGAFI